MAVATGTALLIGGLIGAGTKVAGAVAKGKAEKKAAEQQAVAAQNMTGVAERAYGPYVNRGGQAFNLLADLSGVPGGGASGGGGMPSAPIGAGGGGRPRDDRPITGTAVPRPPVQSAANVGDLAGVVASRGRTQSGFVRMQAPDGSEEDVPGDMAPMFEAEGARRIA
jgi:hypothetical protein